MPALLTRASSGPAASIAAAMLALVNDPARRAALVAAGLDSRPLREQIAGDAEEFQRAMAQLAGAPLSTPAIRTTLELGQGQWVFFDMAIKRQPNARGLEDVATTSERLLEVMDSLTALYEVALQDVLG